MKQSLIPALLLFRILLSAQTVPVDCQTFPLLIFNDLNKMSRLHRVKIDPVSGTALLELFPGVAGSEVNAIGYRLKDKMVYGCQGNQLLRISYWRIFDRWGNLVFERENSTTNDESDAWDGTHNGRKLPAGVYVWLAEIAYPDGRTETLQGDVTILY